MKKIALCTVAVLSVISIQAKAEGFVGGGLGISILPNNIQSLTSQATTIVANANPGITITGTGKQNTTSTSLNLFGGAWLNESLGLEVGYVDLGKLTADVTTTGVATTWHMDVTSTAFYGAALLRAANGIYGKAGIYSASTKETASVTGPGGSASYNATANNTGLLVGLGYNKKFSETLSGRAEFAHFNQVGDKATVGQDNINVISVSLMYSFK